MYTALITELSAYCFGSRRFYLVKFDIKCMIITFLFNIEGESRDFEVNSRIITVIKICRG